MTFFYCDPTPEDWPTKRRETGWGEGEPPSSRPTQKGSNRGWENPGAKLTWEQVRTIRAELGVVAQDQLAERYGVTQSAISRIARQKTWIE